MKHLHLISAQQEQAAISSTSRAASSFSSQQSEALQAGRGSKLPLRTLTTIASTMPPEPPSRTGRGIA
jgi:hypothetical protein